jgi:hypothetical protein
MGAGTTSSQESEILGHSPGAMHDLGLDETRLPRDPEVITNR